MRWGRYLHAKHPNSKTRVITLDLSVKGDPASKYTTAGTVLGIISPLKFHHSITVLLTSVELSLYQGAVIFVGRCHSVQRNILPEDMAQQLLLNVGTHLPQCTVS